MVEHLRSCEDCKISRTNIKFTFLDPITSKNEIEENENNVFSPGLVIVMRKEMGLGESRPLWLWL